MNRDASSQATALLPATLQRANQRTDDADRADARPKSNAADGRGTTLQAQQPANADNQEGVPNWTHFYLEMKLAMNRYPARSTNHKKKAHLQSKRAGELQDEFPPVGGEFIILKYFITVHIEN